LQKYCKKKYNQRLSAAELPFSCTIWFLPVWIIEDIDEHDNVQFYFMELYVTGDHYTRYTTTTGSPTSSSESYELTQSIIAYTHYFYDDFKGVGIVGDLQGIGNHLTDPIIHTVTQKDFSICNAGQQSLDAVVRNHKCNYICEKLGLSKLNKK